jgi:hypothetical protein
VEARNQKGRLRLRSRQANGNNSTPDTYEIEEIKKRRPKMPLYLPGKKRPFFHNIEEPSSEAIGELLPSI